MNSMARRMFELVEPIGVIPYSADEPNEAMFALGFTNYWDTYFAGRAAPLGLVAAEVVDALFYNFAPGEVARHIPRVWRTTTPELAIAARQMGCSKALRRILGDRVDSPTFARAANVARPRPHRRGPADVLPLRAIPTPKRRAPSSMRLVAARHRVDGHSGPETRVWRPHATSSSPRLLPREVHASTTPGAATRRLSTDSDAA